MYEDFIEKRGAKDGPVSMVLAGVHGNERCGVKAFEKIVPELEIEHGTVYFGYGNPRAIEQNIRQTDTNLNRLFLDASKLNDKDKETYEYERAQFLKTYFDKVDVLLDIHATTIEGSPSFAICDKNAEQFATHLPTGLVVSGFNDIEPGGTEDYMNKKGGVGLCVECGYNKDPDSTKVAEESIYAFLSARGHITKSVKPVKKQTYIHMFKLYHTRTDNFTLAKTFQNFEEIQKGQHIGTDGDEEVHAPETCRIVFAHHCSEEGSEGFLLGRETETLV